MTLRKLFISAIALTGTFFLGFAAHAYMANPETPAEPHVTGIGGIFFKADNPKDLKKWYQDNLGLVIDQYGTNFQWYQGADSTKKASTQWSVFKATTTYFKPSKKDFMINYRVNNMDALVKRLRDNNVNIVDTVAAYDYGKFVHIMDPEGNKIELWEPNDEAYSKYLGAVTK